MSNGWLQMDCDSSPVGEYLPCRAGSEQGRYVTATTMNNDCSGSNGWLQVPKLTRALSESACFNRQCDTTSDVFPTGGEEELTQADSSLKPCQQHQIQMHCKHAFLLPFSSHSGTAASPHCTAQPRSQPAPQQCAPSRSSKLFQDDTAYVSDLRQRTADHLPLLLDAQNRFVPSHHTAPDSSTAPVPHLVSMQEAANHEMVVGDAHFHFLGFQSEDPVVKCSPQQQLPHHASRNEEEAISLLQPLHAQLLPTAHPTSGMISPHMRSAEQDKAAAWSSGSVQQQSITVAVQQPHASTPSESPQGGGPQRERLGRDTAVQKASNSPEPRNLVTQNVSGAAACQNASTDDRCMPVESQSLGAPAAEAQCLKTPNPSAINRAQLPSTSKTAMHKTPEDAATCTKRDTALLQQPAHPDCPIPPSKAQHLQALQQPSALVTDFKRAAKQHQRAGPVAQAGNLEQAGRPRTPCKQACRRMAPVSVSRQSLMNGHVIGQVSERMLLSAFLRPDCMLLTMTG